MTVDATAGTEVDAESALAVRDTATFPLAMLGEAEKIVAKANRRLARAGVDDRRFALTVIKTSLREVDEGDEGPVAVEYVTVEVNHPVIEAQGWEFIATAKYDIDVEGVLVRTSPSARDTDNLPVPGLPLLCEHCGTRRSRKKVYLIRHTETGQVMTVGAQCVAPFLGLSVSSLWWLDSSPIEGMEELDGARWGGGVSRSAREVVLAVAWLVSDEGRGFRPSRFGEGATSRQVCNVLWPPLHQTSSERQERRELLQRAYNLVEETPDVVEAIADAAQTVPEISSYGAVVRQLAQATWISPKNVGYLSSLVSVHRRNLDAAANIAVERPARQERKDAPTAGAFADEGAVIAQVPVSVVRISSFENDYGVLTRILTFATESGHHLKWFTTSAAGRALEVGQTVTIVKATVKGLDTFNDQDSTVITRAKIAD